jgi:hypothetical protein
MPTITPGTADLEWVSISISGDKAVACVAGGGLWYSIDVENNWVQSTTDSLNWYSISISGDNAVAGTAAGGLWYSIDAGNSWTQSNTQGTTDLGWYGISISGDNAVACASPGGLWYASVTNIVCFLQTCNIKMIDGTYRNIQDIVKGDVLLSALTGTGIRVTHCGYNTVSDLSLLDSTNHPMRIPRDFFSEGSPAHDVFMSGHHRLFFSFNGHALGLQAFKVVGMENVLTMEEALRVTDSTELRYYHIEVEGGKNAIFCDGLPAETLDRDEWDKGRRVENKLNLIKL